MHILKVSQLEPAVSEHDIAFVILYLSFVYGGYLHFLLFISQLYGTHSTVLLLVKFTTTYAVGISMLESGKNS